MIYLESKSHRETKLLKKNLLGLWHFPVTLNDRLKTLYLFFKPL